jgi:hypothetical protein
MFNLKEAISRSNLQLSKDAESYLLKCAEAYDEIKKTEIRTRGRLDHKKLLERFNSGYHGNPERISVGDKFSVDLDGDDWIKAGVYDLIVYEVCEDKIIVGFDDILCRMAFEDHDDNTKPFLQTKLGSYLNGNLYRSLPDSLKACIVPTTNNEYITLPTYSEVFGPNDRYSDFNWEEDSKQFEFFKKMNHRIKVGLNNDTWWWWLKTPYASDATYFCIVTSTGNADNSSASDTAIGVSPCFAISNLLLRA